MIDRFKVALLRRENLSSVRDTLYDEAERRHNQECGEIEKSFDAARFITGALRTEKTSEQYILAHSFLRRYSAETGEPIAEELTDEKGQEEKHDEGRNEDIDGNEQRTDHAGAYAGTDRSAPTLSKGVPESAPGQGEAMERAALAALS